MNYLDVKRMNTENLNFFYLKVYKFKKHDIIYFVNR